MTDLVEIPFYEFTPEEIIKILHSDAQKGLTSDDVKERHKQYGLNMLEH